MERKQNCGRRPHLLVSSGEPKSPAGSKLYQFIGVERGIMYVDVHDARIHSPRDEYLSSSAEQIRKIRVLYGVPMLVGTSARAPTLTF